MAIKTVKAIRIVDPLVIRLVEAAKVDGERTATRAAARLIIERCMETGIKPIPECLQAGETDDDGDDGVAAG